VTLRQGNFKAISPPTFVYPQLTIVYVNNKSPGTVQDGSYLKEISWSKRCLVSTSFKNKIFYVEIFQFFHIIVFKIFNIMGSHSNQIVTSTNTHTILLFQQESSPISRTFYDFPTLKGAAAGLTQIFENQLRDCNPGRKELSYNMADLYQYIDRVPDLSMLVFDPQTKQYKPLSKSMVKDVLLEFVTSRGSGHR
jgi:hypothetical protein